MVSILPSNGENVQPLPDRLELSGMIQNTPVEERPAQPAPRQTLQPFLLAALARSAMQERVTLSPNRE